MKIQVLSALLGLVVSMPAFAAPEAKVSDIKPSSIPPTARTITFSSVSLVAPGKGMSYGVSGPIAPYSLRIAGVQSFNNMNMVLRAATESGFLRLQQCQALAEMALETGGMFQVFVDQVESFTSNGYIGATDAQFTCRLY